jgi:HK97 family phage major capsid protein
MSEYATKSEIKEAMEIINSQRDIVAKYGIESPEFKQYQENSEKRLGELDKKMEAFTENYEKERKEAEETKERVVHLEGLLAKTQGRDNQEIRKDVDAVANALFKKGWADFVEEKEGNEVNILRAKSYIEYAKKELDSNDSTHGQKLSDMCRAIKSMETKAGTTLRTDIGEMGGFLMPQEWSSEVLKQIQEYSPIRRFADIKTITGKTLNIPIRQGIPTATYEGEAEEGGESNSTFTTTEMTVHRLTNTVSVTWDMLNMPSYNVSNFIMADTAEAFAVAEGRNFVKGNGIKAPEGFIMDVNVPKVQAAGADIAFSDIIAMDGELKNGYDPMYMMNRRTKSYLRLLTDNEGRFLWAPPYGGPEGTAAATINGRRYSSEILDLDDYDTVLGIPIILADFRKFYSIIDRSGISVIEDKITQAKKNVINYTLHSYNTGKVVMKEAGIFLQHQ